MKDKEKKEKTFTNTSETKGNQPSLEFNIKRKLIPNRAAIMQYWLKK
jgi:hypothetical protein